MPLGPSSWYLVAVKDEHGNVTRTQWQRQFGPVLVLVILGHVRDAGHWVISAPVFMAGEVYTGLPQEQAEDAKLRAEDLMRTVVATVRRDLDGDPSPAIS